MKPEVVTGTKIFCIYDSKSEAYMTPWYAQSTGAAIRSFSDEVNNPREGNMLEKHPDDYTLFEIGCWDERSGVLTVYSAKKSLGVGLDFKK